MKKVIYLTLGLVALVLGTIGIFLPVLPTVPLYLLTLFCFSKGSERFYQWFMSTGVYKKHLKTFVENKSIAMDREILLLTGVSAMLVLTMTLINKPIMYAVLVILICIKYGYFLLFVKTTNRFEATVNSRWTAFGLSLVLLFGILFYHNLFVQIAFGLILLVYVIYFGFLAKKKESLQKEIV
ncbi:MAG: YbaN family protein [Erysipelotrichaceae bacterium]|jgi:uncharacterized membrane protein YbaN (DUF454 family)|nr:YbaN family protein [Erysipelotrichaceae bacterium]